MLFSRQKQTTFPENVNWSERAVPGTVAEHEGIYKNSAYLRRMHQVGKENGAWMRNKYAANNGVIRGFHGTTETNARSIAENGFENRLNEENRLGVSAWDEVVGQEALRFAARRAKEAGEAGEGSIVELVMHGPQYDMWHGRLEWLIDAADVEIVAIHTPDEFKARLGEVAVERELAAA